MNAIQQELFNKKIFLKTRTMLFIFYYKVTQTFTRFKFYYIYF